MGESDAVMTWCKGPGQRVFVDKVELGEVEPPPRVYASSLVEGYRPWPGNVFGCPPVTAIDLEWPAFDALSPPVRPCDALGEGVHELTGSVDAPF